MNSALQLDYELDSASTQEVINAVSEHDSTKSSNNTIALTGLLTANIIKNVCQTSIETGKYLSYHYECKKMLESTQLAETLLRKYIETDSKHTLEKSHLELTQKNTKTKNEKQSVQRRLLKIKKDLTEIPQHLADKCLELASYGISLFDYGDSKSRRDAANAVSLGVAGAQGALGIISLNLLDFRKSPWLNEKKRDANDLGIRISELQQSFNQRLATIINQ